jgi:GTP-binding protein EngB required for normal cell division
MEEIPVGKKIVLVGLDNAGKTSIVKLVKDKMFDPLSAAPTKGAERSEFVVLGQRIYIHDLGGQKKYRKKYVEDDVAAYFEAIDVFVYVVDMHDRDRYEETLDYFEKCVIAIARLQATPVFFVFLHKFDGEYLQELKKGSSRASIELNELKDSFQQIVKKHGGEIEEFFQTSVFDEWSCYIAFNRIWTAVVPKVDSFNLFLENLVETNPEVTIALVLDENNNILAKKFRLVDEIDQEQQVEMAAKAVMLLIDWQKSVQHVAMQDHDYAIVEIEDHSIMIHNDPVHHIFLLIYAIGGDYQSLKDRFATIASTLENLI